MFGKSNIKAFILGALCMTILIVTPSAYGAVKEYILHSAQYEVYLNGNEYKDEKPILVHEGNTYIPLRAFADNLGLNLNWNEEDMKVEVKNVDIYKKNVELPDNTPIGEGEVTINGMKVKYGKDPELSTDFVEVDNKKYISRAYVFQSIATDDKVYMFMRESVKIDEFCLKQDLYLKELLSSEIVVKDIPTVIFKNKEFIDYDFYIEHIKDISGE